MKKATLLALLSVAFLLFGIPEISRAQINIVAGGSVSQDFNGIGTTNTAALPTGWKADKNATVRLVGSYFAAGSNTEQIAGNTMSSSATNGIYNYGAGVANAAVDRAVGGISSSSASKSVNVYAMLYNNGSSNIAQLSISYKVEKYRHGTNAAGFSIQMYYSTNGTTWTTAGPSFLSSFIADADNNGYASAPGDSLMVTSQTLSQAIAVNDTLFLAWNYSVTSGTTTSNAQALGIDNVVIFADATSSVVETPTFNPPAGNFFSPTNVTISCATAGATIHYTTDGTDPTESSAVYSTPIPVSVTTTIKAKAYKTGMTPSSIASGLYRFPVDVANIAALRAGATDGTIYRLTGQGIVTYQRPDFNRNQVYLEDATAAIVVDDPSTVMVSNDYNIGDGITNLTGTLSLFNGLLELTPLLDPGAPSSTGNVVTPLPKTLATLTSADQAKLVSIPFVSFSSPTGNYVVNTNYPVTDASGSGVFRTLFAEADYLTTPTAIPTTPQNMIALVGQNGAVIQITPRFASDIEPAAPSWSSGYPKAENASQTVFNAKVSINVPGTSYFVVLPNGAAAPSATQVKNGQDATGTAVASNLAGTITCTLANTEYISGVTGLTPATTYNVYFVAEASGNLQTAPVMVSVTTTLGGTAPVIISPTATSIGTTFATLGGNITSNGGNAITERGTVWSTTSPVTITSNKLAEGGTAVGTFSHSRTGMPGATQIFYAAYATNGIGTTLTSESSFYTLSDEPTNHVTGFATGIITTTAIQLNWTDATGGVVPTGYLIKASDVSYAAIADPVDGTPEANSALVQNVAPGVGTFTFTGLNIGAPYYFKIYPYTGTNATINFKSTSAPQATGTTASAGVYTWNGGNGLWTDAAMWTPTRTTPGVNDVLQFSDGGQDSISGVITQTIGQLKVTNNTTVKLVASAAATVTIGGLASGTDFVVAAGSALHYKGNSAINITIAAAATGSVDGNVSMFGATAATAHRLIVGAASGLTFNAGATFKAGANFSGNAFGGTSAPLGTANSVIFASGSTYLCQAGSNPFALSAPATVTIFQSGSLFKVIGNVTPAFSGRNYADFEVDYAGAISPTGGSAVTMNNLTITTGTLNFGVTANPGHLIKGNISVATGATLNFSPASAGTVKLAGTSAQTISGGGTISSNTFSTLEVTNAAGVTLNANATLNGTLTLSGGLLTLGTGNLTFSATGTLSGTPSATNMIVATGSGELRKVFTATGSYTFPVGDNTGTAEYSPVAITVSAGTFTSAYMGVKLSNSAYTGVTGNYINRYWDVTASGIDGLTYDATFTYLPADVVGTEASMVCALMSPPTNYAAANTTTHQLTASAVTTAGTFTGKDPFSADKTLTLKVYLEGLYAGGGVMNQAYDELGPHFGAGIADVVTIELRNSTTGAIEYTLSNVNLSTNGDVSATVPAVHAGSYYIYVKHRNSIPTSTANPVSFAGATISYDFSTSAAQAFGSNQQNLLLSGVFGLFGGDENQDGLVDSSDMIDADNDAAAFVSGYTATDVNGDGLVDSSDMIIIDNNATAFVASSLPF